MDIEHRSEDIWENGICHAVLDILGHSVKLYWMDTAVLTDTAVFDAAYQMLPRWRREKADFYLRAADQRLSVAAGLLFLRGLADYGINGQEAEVSFGQYGKPFLTKHPGIHFNLSHGGSLAIAVFADTDVGCDVEQVGQADLELAEKFFCAGEYAGLVQMQEKEAQDRAFYQLWTLKESFVKAAGLGLGKLPLDALEVEVSVDGTVNVRQQVDGAAYGFWQQCGAGMCLGVCVRVQISQL